MKLEIEKEDLGPLVELVVAETLERVEEERRKLGEPQRVLLSKREAAQALGVSQSTIDRLRREAGLPAVQLDGRVMFRPAALDAWAASRETARNAGPMTTPKATLDKAHSME